MVALSHGVPSSSFLVPHRVHFNSEGIFDKSGSPTYLFVESVMTISCVKTDRLLCTYRADKYNGGKNRLLDIAIYNRLHDLHL